MEEDGSTSKSVDEKVNSNIEQALDVLVREDGVTSVLITGPYAIGRVSLNDKLYFVVITDREDGVIEHHFLDELGLLKAPIEIGKFPKPVVDDLLEHGYDDMVSFRALESIRAGKVLYDPNGLGAAAIEKSKQWMPKKRFIGDLLHQTRANLDDARSVFSGKDYKNAVLVSRAAVNYAMQLLAAGGKSDLSGQGTDPLAIAQNCLTREQLETYRKIQGFDGASQKQAETTLRLSIEFSKHVLSEMGIEPDYLG